LLFKSASNLAWLVSNHKTATGSPSSGFSSIQVLTFSKVAYWGIIVLMMDKATAYGSLILSNTF
jgi:hypothetical protein